MLSNRQNVMCSNTVVRVPLASVDICDIDSSSDDDGDDKNDISANKNGLAPTTAMVVMVNEQCPNKQIIEQNMQDHSETDKLLTSSMNGFRQPHPSTINLKQIAGVVVKVNDNDITDGCFKRATEDSDRGSSGKGINIQFHDIIYRARHEFSWDRCKYSKYTSQFKQIEGEEKQMNNDKDKNQDIQFKF